VMRIAGTSEPSNLRTHPALPASPGARPSERRPQDPSLHPPTSRHSGGGGGGGAALGAIAAPELNPLRFGVARRAAMEKGRKGPRRSSLLLGTAFSSSPPLSHHPPASIVP